VFPYGRLALWSLCVLADLLSGRDDELLLAISVMRKGVIDHALTKQNSVLGFYHIAN
jgi:hypothetical protein